MPYQIVLRQHVPGDIAEILEYLASKSRDAARNFAANLDPSLLVLAEFPGAGGLKHFRGKALSGIRSWSVSGFPNHLIYYRILQGVVEILAISQGARGMARVLRSRV